MSGFDAGIFTVGTTGTLSFDYLLDGGSYQGQLAIFNLQGIEQYTPGSTAFIQEAARRALTESNLGHVVIDDITVGAKFKANIPWEGDSNELAQKGGCDCAERNRSFKRAHGGSDRPNKKRRIRDKTVRG
ncbi:hypothetical protein [Argonema antarcticum]|uniref:hypothetical protein n=1 Tax=Argonema antarcticum TaxID=2942763 RepID=UPI00201162FD|nr:hypothetical protein [Argonema antarcticum]MCL1474596.1 hypothetical protein [Argonema antarcticum A004/B2]